MTDEARCPATRVLNETGVPGEEIYSICLAPAGHRGDHDWDEE